MSIVSVLYTLHCPYHAPKSPLGWICVANKICKTFVFALVNGYIASTGNSFGLFSENHQGLGPARCYVSLPQKKAASLTIDPRCVPRPRNLLKPECRHCVHNVKQSSRDFRWGEGELARSFGEKPRKMYMSFKITNGSFSSGSRNLNHHQTQCFFLWLDDFGRFFSKWILQGWPLPYQLYMAS